MIIRITSASLPRLAKVLARFGIPSAAVRNGVTYLKAETLAVRICRVDLPLPGFAADIYSGADAAALGER